MIPLQMTTAILFLLVSTFYHTALNHPEPVAHMTLQLDYVGVLVGFLATSSVGCISVSIATSLSEICIGHW